MTRLMGVASLTAPHLTNAYIDDALRWGRVEVCVGGAYSTVCNDGSFKSQEASVACRALGFSPYGANVVTSGVFLLGNNSQFVGQVVCSGEEPSLLNCTPGSSLTGCENAAAVICQGRWRMAPVHSSITAVDRVEALHSHLRTCMHL